MTETAERPHRKRAFDIGGHVVVLEGFFTPRAIAVVGASRDEGKVGRIVLDNLIEGGFAGEIYPVNPSCDVIRERTCYPVVTALPGAADLAIVVVPAPAVPTVIEECGAAGIHSAIVISAGFKESGTAGSALEHRLCDAATTHGVRVLGPNCLGVIDTRSSLNASFAPFMPARGGIAFMSQSGALGTAILDWARGEGIGLASFVSLGNRADLSEIDLLECWTDDDEVTVVAAYLESVTDGRRFVEAVRECVTRKPVIVLKAGRSDAGARAVSSHTGSLAGSAHAYRAALRAAGALQATTVEELFDFANAFSRQPVPRGQGLTILTNAGGPAIMATDACDTHAVELSSLSADTVTGLRQALPPAAALYNPVDVLGDAPPERYATAAALLARDPSVRALLAILTPQATTDAVGTARAVTDALSDSGVTLATCFMGHTAVAEAVDALRDLSVPNYPFPERAVAALGAMQRYRSIVTQPPVSPLPVEADRGLVRTLIDHARAARRSFITENSAQRIATAYGIPVPPAGLATDLADALSVASEIGYPVVLKIASPDILHKTDIGGIRLGIRGPGELRSAYESLLSNARTRMPDARIWGVLVQKMLPTGRELILGVDRDPQFGPLLMVGLGGVYVEVLQDVTFRLCPVTPADARTMLTEIRGYGLIRGTRGQQPADVDAIIDAICRVSALVTDFDDIVELDINPLIVNDRGHGALAADIRIGIGG